MKREHYKKLLPIIEAYANGEPIQIKKLIDGWEDIEAPAFQASPELYRIKPKQQKYTTYHEVSWENSPLKHRSVAPLGEVSIKLTRIVEDGKLVDIEIEKVDLRDKT